MCRTTISDSSCRSTASSAYSRSKEPAQHRRRCRKQQDIRIRIEQDQHLQPRIQQFAAVPVVAKLELRRCERRLRPDRRAQPDVLVRPEFGANSSSVSRILFITQSQQIEEYSETSELNYPKDPTEDPYKNYKFIYRTDHLNNTYLSSVLLGGNGPAVPEGKGGRLYSDYEQPYVKLQVTALDVGGKAVVWQDGRGGLIAKDVCRNYRGNGFTDWRLPRVTEMKLIMMWAISGSKQMERF